VDPNLSSLLDKMERQCEVLGRARNDYLAMEAERKHFEARLVQLAEGKSQAEKVTNAQASEDYLEFHKKLARLLAVFEFQKLKFEVLDREFWAVYGAHKSEDRMIRKMGS